MELQACQQRERFEVVVFNGSKQQEIYKGSNYTRAMNVAKDSIAQGAKRLKVYRTLTAFRQPEQISVILEHKIVVKKKKMLAKSQTRHTL